MRLYLSSYHFGNQPKEFVSLLKRNKNVAVISNARDHLEPGLRAKKLIEQIDDLANLGLAATDLDLRDYFSKQGLLRDKLKKFEAVWITGGNAFLLRQAMYNSGFDKIIVELLVQDKIVYAGYSAAIVVLSASLRGLELVDDINAVQTIYHSEPVWEGLNILPYTIAPHFQSDHSESSAIDQEIEFYQKENIPYKTLRDGQVLIINGDKEKTLS
ncbi:MAG: Type 1 glutamine amidotransferase-like domain-containing protein [Patescibacteria group bacterium]